MLAMTVEELIQSAQAGDQAAFAELLATHERAVYNLCYRMVGNASEAEDAAQETFLRAFSQLYRYDPGRPFKTWLLAVASHHCIDRLRRRRLQFVSLDDEPLQQHPALRERLAGPEEAALRQEESREIQTMLAGLLPESRNALIMRYWYDWSYEEIAEATGATVSAVKSRLHRARVALGEMFAAPSATSRIGGRAVVFHPGRQTRSSRPTTNSALIA
jgi:RNA polymerase sigma-70 factor (ECF subfamily)